MRGVHLRLWGVRAGERRMGFPTRRFAVLSATLP